MAPSHPTVAEVLSKANDSGGHVAVITQRALQVWETALLAQRLALLPSD